MNHIILIGNLGKEAKYIEDSDLTVFDIATSQFYKENPNSTEFKQATQWHRIFCNRYLAAKTKDLQKGDKVVVTGILKYKPILDNQGFKQQTAYVQASKIEILTPKKIDPMTHNTNSDLEAQRQAEAEFYADEQIPF